MRDALKGSRWTQNASGSCKLPGSFHMTKNAKNVKQKWKERKLKRKQANCRPFVTVKNG